VDRLITNLTAYIKEHPLDPMGPYTLARVHYLALVNRAADITALEDRRDPRSTHLFEPSPDRPMPADKTESREDPLRNHLTLAVENYRKALQMDDKNGLFHLGLASVSRAALNAGFKLGPIPGAVATEAPKDGDFTPLWREQAIAEYLKAYQLSLDTRATIMFGIPGDQWEQLASYEAGQGYVYMVTARGVRDSERQTLEKIKASLKTLETPVGFMITPIIFSVQRTAPLSDLIDAKKKVAFDLDGTGRQQRYLWLRPDTGILVWDPWGEGRITSGRQLFGSVTFRMFWADGYRALDALDDNRDGELRGKELQGLAVWFDRNQNGVSDRGEVIPIERSGSAAISARATSSVGVSLANERGLVMTDGRILPTYDWTTSPLKENKMSPRAIPRS
jgi:hypothetical protein